MDYYEKLTKLKKKILTVVINILRPRITKENKFIVTNEFTPSNFHAITAERITRLQNDLCVSLVKDEKEKNVH